MKKKFVLLIFFAFIISGCGVSESAIQTARAETETAKPTKSNTTAPTNTVIVHPTETQTASPTGTPSDTPMPHNAFQLSTEKMMDQFEDWTGSDFIPASDYQVANGYSGQHKELEIDMFLYSVNGNAVGFMLKFENAPPVEIREKIDFTFKAMDQYIGLSALTWMGDNWPASKGETVTTEQETEHGVAILSIEFLEDASSLTYEVSLFDKGFISGDISTSDKVMEEPTATATEFHSTSEPDTIGENEEFDGRVGISVTKVDIPGDLPEENGLPDAEAGFTYVSIYLTVTKIEGVHLLNIPFYEKEEPYLLDDEGQSYPPKFSKIVGVKFKDLKDLRSDYEIIEGAQLYLVFGIIEGRIPVKLNLLYGYQYTWDDSLPQNRG